MEGMSDLGAHYHHADIDIREHEIARSLPSQKTCRNCGKSNLRWKLTAHG